MNMDKEILSVVIPIYNEEEHLEECVNSVLNQTYKYLEVILVDDGSTDSSGDLCDAMAVADTRVRVIHQENKGMIEARYAGLRIAQGSYSIFIDADDFIELNAYEEMMVIALGNDADLVTSGCYRYRGKDDMTKDVCSRVEVGLYDSKEKIADVIYPIMLWEAKTNTWAIDPSLCMKIVKRKYFLEQYEKLHGQSFSYGEDSAIIYPAILNMQRIYVTHNCYYYHRQRPNNVPAAYLISKEFPENLYLFYKYMYQIFSDSKYADMLIKQLDMFYIRSVSFLVKRYAEIDLSGKREIKKNMSALRVWMFPFNLIKKNQSVVIYGAGIIGSQFYKQLVAVNYCSTILWVDKRYNEINGVDNPEKAIPKKYDYVVIAIKDFETSCSVKAYLMEKGWKELQIITPDFERIQINV